jgi:hypothetical protein
MALTDQQRAELDAEGIRNVQMKLLRDVGGARNRPVGTGFASGDKMLRGDVEDWLAAKERGEARQQRWILACTIIAAAGAVVLVLIEVAKGFHK